MPYLSAPPVQPVVVMSQPQMVAPQPQMAPNQMYSNPSGYMPPYPGSNPNEKHIYYGPNGEVLPGPPQGFNTHGPVNFRDFPEDFAIEGILHHGRLTSVHLVEASHGFPKIPDFLTQDLFDKYKQFGRTIVRIVLRGGQAYVHAMPDFGIHSIPGRELPIQTERPEPALGGGVDREYVPVYLDEDEEFDYDKFMQEYRAGKYGRGVSDPNAIRQLQHPDARRHGDDPVSKRYRTPPPVPRSYPLPDNDRVDRRQFSPDIRPNTEDPMEHLRWRRDGPGGRHTSLTNPDRNRDTMTQYTYHHPGQTAPSRYREGQPHTRNYRTTIIN